MATILYIVAPHVLVMHCGMYDLSKQVSPIEFSFFPNKIKLLLNSFVTQPMELHVPSFGHFLLDSTMYVSFGCGVVCFDDCWWLSVTHSLQKIAYMECKFCVMKTPCVLASAAEVTTCLMVLHSTRREPL